MLNSDKITNNKFFFNIIFATFALFSTTILFSNTEPLFKKLEACLPQNALKQQKNTTSNNLNQKKLKSYLAAENKKHLWLYKEIIADATPREKIEKAAVILTTLFLAYKNFYAFVKDPAKQSTEQVPHYASKYIYGIINALIYTLFYEYLVTPEKMSRPLAGIMFAALSSKPFTNAQFHGLVIYWALHHIFLQTTSDKLSNFLNCDTATWATLKKQIPHQLLLEFETLHNDFLKYKTIMLEPSEQNHLIKKISLGRSLS